MPRVQLAAMNEALGITTLLLPARPGLAAISSTVMRGLGTWLAGSRDPRLDPAFLLGEDPPA